MLSGCSSIQGVSDPENSASTHRAIVDKVVDGDTIRLQDPVLGTKKVRLLSVDAPETHYEGKGQEPWGQKSADYLSALLPEGTKITIETDQEEKDRYGRLLAHIKKGKQNINLEMVKQGHAVTYFIYPNQNHFKVFQDAYLQAKRAGKGMWNSSNPIPELPFEFRARISHKKPEKYIGNYNSKQYVTPEKYKEIPIEKRIFFFSEADAKKAGYTLKK